MAVNFNGRISPNIQRDPNGVLEIIFNRPTTADNVTILIKELDTYRDSNDVQINEGSEDDLLATFTGRIRSKHFEVDEHNNESNETSLPTVRIKFQGSDEIYTIPIVSQAGEAEGTNWEIAFTVQYPGQGDYNSPVSFIPQARGRALIVDNTMGDLSGYESHANLIRNYFATNNIEAKIIRGTRSTTTTSNYSAADTEDFAGGIDRDIFIRNARNFNYVYFNCHGDINLIGIAYGDQTNSCILCENRFAHRAFTTCTQYGQCNRADRGYYFYKLRTANNSEIRVEGPVGSSPMEWEVSDWDLRQIICRFVVRNDYHQQFANANPGDPNITTTPGSPPTYDLTIPNNFQFPSLIAFPETPLRPDFREDNLIVNAGVKTQDPDSPYLHDSAAESVPGVPVICFIGLGGSLSSEANATPTAAAGTPTPTLSSATPTEFNSPPANLQTFPGNNQISLVWDAVAGADRYTLYRATSPGVDEHNSTAIKNIFDNSYDDTDVVNGQIYYYKVQALRPGGNFSPSVAESVDFSQVKVMYAGCCLAGRKKVLAEAILNSGAKFFIGHQVVTANVAEQLINRFWERWLRAGAILRNVVSVFSQTVQSNAGPFGRTRPVVYYKDNTNTVRFWRPTMALPNPADIKIN